MNDKTLILTDLIRQIRLYMQVADWVPEHSTELYAGFGIMHVTGERLSWDEIKKIAPDFIDAWKKEEQENIRLGLNRLTGEPLRDEKKH